MQRSGSIVLLKTDPAFPLLAPGGACRRAEGGQEGLASTVNRNHLQRLAAEAFRILPAEPDPRELCSPQCLGSSLGWRQARAEA